ncbi:cysteine desulfurase [Crocinitomicaceae bacterium]|jgi:cysteine desulfurase/selenocysteine lyase|nr:cysteine desulfurase [Crocinitomicaceae bacterium]MDB4649399.1 cysteine desulfurase [Crocinitomicaceae bacterium]
MISTPDYIHDIRADFPILQTKIHNKPLVYFDNAATTQKPKIVIDRIRDYYENENANIHRGVHHLSQVATQDYENARSRIQKYIGAAKSEEIIFTKGTTDGINLVASSFGALLKEGDEILISAMEHHSNIVPWQLLADSKKLQLKVIPIHKDGTLIMDAFDQLLSEKTKLVSITHISNTLGTINPIESIISKSHAVGAKVLIDGAQSIQHGDIDVSSLNCDFFVFSGHKIFGPTGIGVLYGKEKLLEEMPPYQGGGDMIKNVSFEKTTFNELPFKFEAGTPNIIGGIALGTAIEYIESIDRKSAFDYEKTLLEYAEKELLKIEDVQVFGNSSEKTSLVSFNVGSIHPFDLGTLLDKQGIAVRTGHHCTQPLMDFYNIPGTIRASFSIYNTVEEVDLFLDALRRAITVLS